MHGPGAIEDSYECKVTKKVRKCNIEYNYIYVCTCCFLILLRRVVICCQSERRYASVCLINKKTAHPGDAPHEEYGIVCD